MNSRLRWATNAPVAGVGAAVAARAPVSAFWRGPRHCPSLWRAPVHCRLRLPYPADARSRRFVTRPCCWRASRGRSAVTGTRAAGVSCSSSAAPRVRKKSWSPVSTCSATRSAPGSASSSPTPAWRSLSRCRSPPQELVALRANQISNCGAGAPTCTPRKPRPCRRNRGPAQPGRRLAQGDRPCSPRPSRPRWRSPRTSTRLADAHHGVSDETWAQVRKHTTTTTRPPRWSPLVAMIQRVQPARRDRAAEGQVLRAPAWFASMTS